jgi:hypothetical protein
LLKLRISIRHFIPPTTQFNRAKRTEVEMGICVRFNRTSQTL